MNRFKIRIVEGEDFSEKVLTQLKSRFEVAVGACTQAEIPNMLRDYDVFWFRLGFKITEEIFPADNRCKIIATPVTGIDHIDQEACRKRGIHIVCLRGETEFLKNVRATAEHTVLLTLMLLRNASASFQHVLAGGWNRDLFRGNEIYKKTVGIIGMGRLGSIVAEYFTAMGANVIGYDTREDFPGDKAERVHSLNELAQQADIISVHVALNESTKNMLNEAFFVNVKSGSWFINTSRGGIVNEEALLQSLRNGRLKGAALDVIADEYFRTSSNTLMEYARVNTNLVITPHIGGNTYESFEKTEAFIAEKIIALLC